ncbi:hypothetical protein MTO96_048802 [Rhipicephalus appendiculatus]
MGNAFRRGLSGQRGGLTDREKRLIRNSWRKFCEQNPDYGVRIFIGMFAKHPEYLQMFPRFRDKELRTLRDDAKFRAHACAVGHQLSAIVECIEDDEVFNELIRKNAANHLPRAGVGPSNFESLFSAALEQMVASNRALMTPATVSAWEKLFKIMNQITRNVYEDAAEFSANSQETSSGDDLSLVEPVVASAEHSKSDAAEAPGGTSPAQVPLTTQETAAGTSEKPTKEAPDGAPRTSRTSTAAPAGERQSPDDEIIERHERSERCFEQTDPPRCCRAFEAEDVGVCCKDWQHASTTSCRTGCLAWHSVFGKGNEEVPRRCVISRERGFRYAINPSFRRFVYHSSDSILLEYR